MKRGEKRRYFLELLGIRERKKGSKGRSSKEGESEATTLEKRQTGKGDKAEERRERERKRLRNRRENVDCLIPHLNSEKAGKKAAQKLNPLGVDIHLKAAIQ